MSALNRRRITLIGLSGISLAAAGAMAPGAFAAGTIDGDVKVSNTETVQVLMGANGKVDAQRVYEQLVLSGQGKVDIANPVSTKGLRNLDGFGGFDVRDGKARIKTSVDGTKKFRSVSDFTKKLPLDIKITYTLDGKKMDPSDIVGKSGELEVRYVVTNVTGTNEDVSFKDGNGKATSSPEDVVIPMVGTLETTLPPSFTKVVPDGANAAGDGRGGTLLSYTMTLIPPIGKATAEIGYKAKVKNAVIPKADVSALPVDPLTNTSFKGGAESYAGGAQTGQDLTAGATEIDTNLLKIRDGASDLVAGILQLKDGADKLSTGLDGQLVPGAEKIADGNVKVNEAVMKLGAGTGQLSAGAGKVKDGAKKLSAGNSDLSAGAKKLLAGADAVSDGAGQVSAGATKLNKGASDLSDGTGQVSAGASQASQGASDLAAGTGQVKAGATSLSDGLKTAADGGPALLAGVAQLKGGAQLVDAGLSTLNGQVVPGANQISGGAAQLIGALDAQLIPGLAGAVQYIDAASAAAGNLPDSTDKATIQGALSQAKALVNQVKGGLDTTVRGGLNSIKTGATQIAAGVDAQTSAGAAGNSGTLKNGLAQIIGGLTQLQTKGGELVDGLDQLSAGADQLKAGAGQVDAGAGQLKTGTGSLAAGAGQVDAGAKQLKTGSGDLAAGAGKVSDGAGQLKSGTSQLSAGADKLKVGAGQLAGGTGDLKAGADKLDAGATKVQNEGTGPLASGATKLAEGLVTAADGSNKIADGLGTAAESAPALPEGATELSEKGTSQIVSQGDATAKDFGLRYALLAAGADRAATAQPYGSPEGATALTAYKFEIAGAEGADSANLKRGLAAVVLLGMAGLLATIRRRGII